MQLSLDNVYDVIEVAEMFFLPDLKRQCGVFLTGFVEIDNAVDLIFTARLFNIPKLEHSCVEFMAKNIEEVIIQFIINNLLDNTNNRILKLKLLPITY